MDIKQKLKIYFEYEARIENVRKTILDLQAKKNYILDTLKAMTYSDMPKGTGFSDISDRLDETSIIDDLIRQQTRQLQMIEQVKLEMQDMLSPLTEQEMIVLERRIYGCKVFVISQRVHVCDKTYHNIKNRIKQKIGVQI